MKVIAFITFGHFSRYLQAHPGAHARVHTCKPVNHSLGKQLSTDNKGISDSFFEAKAESFSAR